MRFLSLLYPSLLAVALVTFGARTCRAQVSTRQPVWHYIHGQWFDGKQFRSMDFYAEDGILTHRPSSGRDVVTVDLHDGYVVPPYGDAHEHNFDSVAITPPVTEKYLRDGIFYAQGMTDSLSGSRQVVAAGLVNTPHTVDVTYAHGCLTATNGHPKEIYESLAHGFYYPATDAQRRQVIGSHEMRGDAYWEVDSAADFERVWPTLLTAKPSLIKIMLLDSENFRAPSPDDPRLGRGLNPALVPLITARAHAAGLKVAAHVDTATDYHIALTGGVDEMGHLPGYGIRAGEDLTKYHLSDADIALTARRHIPVQATAGIYVDKDTPAADIQHRQASQIDNLKRLKAAGVSILIGSDHYGEDAVHEADYLQSLGIWSNGEMLRMWSVTTPQVIFPQRRIGRLELGYEASFLVLSANPLTNWSATHQIVDRWKQGNHLTSPESSPAPVSGAAKKSEAVRDVQEDGFRGRLYMSSSQPALLSVIVIGGSEGHLYLADEIGPQLAALGFDVLGIDYHDGFDGTRRLSQIPIETFIRAVSYLRASGARHVALLGDSRGSEAALLTAAHDHEVSGVAAIVPSSVLWGGYGDDAIANASAWTWQGHSLPFLAFPPNAPAGAAGFDAALDQTTAVAAATIPVEQIQCSVFLAGSESDEVWPSARMVHAIEKQLENRHSGASVEALTFPDSSHRLLGTGPSATSITYHIDGKDYHVEFGGTASGTETARDQTWTALTAFFHSLAQHPQTAH